MNKKIVKTDKAPGAIGPYSQGVVVGDLVFFSGQIAIDPAIGDMITGGLEDQAHQVFKNIGALLESQGLGYGNVVKATCFLTNLGDFGKMNEIYATYFTSDFPARSAVEVSALPKGALLEIEVIAAL